MTEISTAGDDATTTRGHGVDLRVLLMLMCVALALVVGAISGLTIALPGIAADLGATQTQLSYVINVYALTFAGLLLPVGFAADRYSRKGFLLGGLLVFGGASATAAFVGEPATLIALRALAGAGAAAIMPATLSVLVDAFPPERRTFAVSVWAGVSGAGAMLGIVLSGVLLNFFWWGSFLVAIGLIALVCAAGVAAVAPDSRNPGLALDPAGGALAFVGLSGLVLGVIEGPERGWTEPVTIAALAVAVVALGVFVVVEARQDDPMLDVRLFRRRGLAAGAALVFLQFLAAYVLFYLLPQFLQFVQGEDALGAALRLLPMVIGIAPASSYGPQLLERFGARAVAAVGMGLMSASYLGLALNGDGAYWPIGLSLVVFGLGFGLSITPGTQLIIDGLPADRRTVSAAVNDVTREVGAALGGALAASLLVAVYSARLDVEGLPPQAAQAAEDGVGAALGVAEGLGPQGEELVASAQVAFTGGFEVAHLVGAGLLLVGALVAWFVAPQGLGQGVGAGTSAASDDGPADGTDDEAGDAAAAGGAPARTSGPGPAAGR